jgi:predicted DNA binding CopG/RHH family protein
MKEGRLHLRLNEDLLEAVKMIADKRGVTITFLVDQYFRRLVGEDLRQKSDEELGVNQA